MKIQSNLCNLWIFLVSFLLIILISQEALAGNIFRVIGGAGVTKTSFDYEGMESSNHHYGVQFVSYVSDKHAYGIEIASHRVFKSKEKTYEYLSVCIILEAMPYRVLWLNQMGIAGYIWTSHSKSALKMIYTHKQQISKFSKNI
ncbi:MAG: hypothetical protein V2A53_03245 [bacterium]